MNLWRIFAVFLWRAAGWVLLLLAYTLLWPWRRQIAAMLDAGDRDPGGQR